VNVKKTLASIVAAVAVLVAPDARPLQAGDCTTSYQYCLNDTWDLNVVLRSLADVACFDQYLTCVGQKLLFG
jgi:hypothetical protein